VPELLSYIEEMKQSSKCIVCSPPNNYQNISQKRINDDYVMNKSLSKDKLTEKIIAEIALSQNAGETIKKWRTYFEISQADLARTMVISPSVISDYEAGRRKSPGIKLINKIVNSIIEINANQQAQKHLKDTLKETYLQEILNN
jgi:predicted transcriptional regulator